MLNNDFFKDVKGYVFDLFKKSLPQGVVYHNQNHTLQVVKAANEIALAENITDKDLEILLLAAWFHDIGFTNGLNKHEEKSKKIVAKYLSEKGFSKEKITKIQSVINASIMPQNPTNKLDEILCDADLFHLGTTDFDDQSNLLRLEQELLNGKELTDIEWLQENERFLSDHKYFTNYAFEKLNAQKKINWVNINNKLRKAKIKLEEQKIKNSSKKASLKLKKDKESRPGRGVETMFRVTHRNHLKLSDIADTKANILLSVSAIILSIALSTLFPKLDKPDNYYLIYPTLIFLFITVVTMVFSILSTRPKVTSGKFTKEDISNKKVNLLFFGNFHKMKLEDYQKGMIDMMNDNDYLYKSLINDLYYLGKVLNKKYKLLRIAYTIFMYGIIISVIAFVIAFEMMKNTNVG
ncbi:MAG: Pycsar system effector family protein [Bacteroidota bacterium]